MKGFKLFLLRGNIVDLAVGIVIGAAFSGVVVALVKDLLTPLIGALAKAPDFSGLSFTVNGSKFLYGDFINSVLAFVIASAAVYFFVVLPVNRLMASVKKAQDPTTRKCLECLSDVPIAARRCMYCTSVLN